MIAVKLKNEIEDDPILQSPIGGPWTTGGQQKKFEHSQFYFVILPLGCIKIV